MKKGEQMDNTKLIYKKNLLIKNKLNTINYYITANLDSFLDEPQCPYGIKVEKDNGEKYILNNKFTSYEKAKTVLSTLAKYKVTPVICSDVIEDLLKK